MRLPPYIIQTLFSRIDHRLTVGMAILLLGLVPVEVGATTSQLAWAPTILRFGATVVGQTETLPVILTNSGQTSATISGITASNSEFAASSLSLPLVLLAGQSVELSVSFTPTVMGWTGGAIKFISSAANVILSLEVRGTGVSSEAVTATPSIVSFGQVAIGTVSTVPVVLTNARSWKITFSALQTTGVGFSINGSAFPLTLDGGQSVTLNISFAPQGTGTTAGSLFISGAGRAIPLSGIGTASGQLIANPAGLAFGSVQVGGTLTLMDSFTNTGGTSVTISQATATGTGFSIVGLSFPLLLNPGASVTFNAEFAPQSAVNSTGGIIVSSNASDPSLNVSLSGTGTALGQLTLAPTVLNFGNTTVGSSVSQTSNLSAAGASVTVSSANLSSAEFSLTGMSFPATIVAGQSTPITLTFSPQTSGSASAVLAVVSNASNATTQTMNGVGVAPTQHSVSLSWTDSDSGIVDYNIYRGSVSGGPYAQLNSGSESTAAYSDNSVVAGQTYYYVTTAVDGKGVESRYSNEAEAVIPTP
jgi:Abnormal spindle-like microcephaly-assoc'd, ASPM-SPD-2-Hydin